MIKVFDDKGIGRYTYYSPMEASTIDYVTLREDYLISKFEEFSVIDGTDETGLL